MDAAYGFPFEENHSGHQNHALGKELMPEEPIDLGDLTQEQKGSLEFKLILRRSWIQIILAISTTFAFFGLLCLLLFHAIPSSSEDIIDILIGNFGTAWIMIMTFYFQQGLQKTQSGKNGNQVAPEKVVDSPKS
jgi:hypothetical protein